MGKHKYSKATSFSHISCEALICIISKIWEKWISIVSRKFGKTQTFLKGFIFFSCETEIHAVPKTWDKWISMWWKKYGRTLKVMEKHSKLMDFLNILREAEIQYISQTTWWVNSHVIEQVWESTDNFQVLFYLTDLVLMKTHAIPTVWECTNSHTIEIFCRKPYHFQAVEFWRNMGMFSPSPSKIDRNNQ